MHYYSTAYPVFTSTNSVALEIYLSGCNAYPRCKGCHSPHTWAFDTGLDMDDNDVMTKIVNDISEKYHKGLLDSICILGGEPLDNPVIELIAFMEILQHKFPDVKYWLYTHYTEKNVRTAYEVILPYFDYIKVGAFNIDEKVDDPVPDLLTGIRLATPNQYVIRGERASKN